MSMQLEDCAAMLEVWLIAAGLPLAQGFAADVEREANLG